MRRVENETLRMELKQDEWVKNERKRVENETERVKMEWNESSHLQ